MVLSRYAGAAVRRKEDPRLITGASTYVDDITLPNLVHAAFVRSPYAHARINGIDASEALAMPGVVAVFTESDIRTVMPDIYPKLAGDTGQDAEEVADEDDASIPVPDVYPLAWDKLRYVGEAVAVVIAETKAQAEDAAVMVVIDAEPLEAVIDPYEATEDGAPLHLRRSQEQHQRPRGDGSRRCRGCAEQRRDPRQGTYPVAAVRTDAD